MKRFLVCAGGHSKSVLNASLAAGMRIDGILDSIEQDYGKQLLSVDIQSEKKHRWCKENFYHVACRDRNLKQKLLQLIERQVGSENFFSVIHPSATVSFSSEIGSGSCILANSYVGPNSKIGRHCCINTNCVVEHDCMVEDGCFLGPSVTICGSTYVGCNATIGASATIIDGLRIEKSTTIAAGSVVTKDATEVGATYIGIPARNRNK